MADNDYIYDGKNGGIQAGYYVNNPNRDPRNKKPSAFLENNVGKRIYLWVTEVTSVFGMGGSFAQSVSTRTFYPRNFTQATMTFKGVMPNSYQYNRLAEFVRSTHLRANRDEDGGRIIRLVMAQNDLVKRGPRYKHRNYDLDGYITTIGKGARRFEFQPTFEFEFVIATSRQGLFQTDPATVSQLVSWAQIAATKGFSSGFVSDPGNSIKTTLSVDKLINADVPDPDPSP